METLSPVWLHSMVTNRLPGSGYMRFHIVFATIEEGYALRRKHIALGLLCTFYSLFSFIYFLSKTNPRFFM